MFAKDPDAQAMQTLIHDTNAGFANVRFAVKTIIEKLNTLGIKDEEIEKELEYIKKSSKIMNTIDNYYRKWENNFQ